MYHPLLSATKLFQISLKKLNLFCFSWHSSTTERLQNVVLPAMMCTVNCSAEDRQSVFLAENLREVLNSRYDES